MSRGGFMTQHVATGFTKSDENTLRHETGYDILHGIMFGSNYTYHITWYIDPV